MGHGEKCQSYHGAREPDDPYSHLQAGADGADDDDIHPPPPPASEGVPARDRKRRLKRTLREERGGGDDEQMEDYQEKQEDFDEESEGGVLDADDPGFIGPLQIEYLQTEEGEYLVPEGDTTTRRDGRGACTI